MDKVTDFLERYVQWVALGIAVLFLGYAVYSYMPGLTTPVLVDVKGEQVSPGAADDKVYSEIAKPLDDEINNGKAFASIPVPAYGSIIHDRIAAPATRPTLVSTAFSVRPIELPPDINFNVVNDPATVDTTKVRKLPTLPAAILAPDPTTGFAQVDPNQSTNGTGGATPAAAAAAPQPGRGIADGGGAVLPVGGRPGTAAPVATAGAAPVSGTTSGSSAGTLDVTWVRVPYTIPTQQMLAAFRAVNLPQDWSKTTILHVDLMRQKQLADGGWSPEEVVAALPITQLDPMPAANASQQQQQQYNAYAITNESQIIQPVFYHVIAGDDPTLEQAAAAPEVDANAFDPTHYPAGANLRGLTQDQIRQVVTYRNQAEAERRKQQQQPQQPTHATHRTSRSTGGGASGEGGGGGGARQPPNRNTRPNPTPTPRPTVGLADGSGATVAGAGVTTPTYVPPPPGNPIQLTAVPTAPFSPGDAGNDIQGVAYDTTATSEATYRYRIRYSATNPIFGSQNVADPATLALTFALVGEDANTWSTPVTIAPLTHIFLAAAPRANMIVRFNVFRWQAGHWQVSNATANSGDSIGKLENGTDFRTPWTLVEVRADSSSPNSYVQLMNADGTLRRQEFEKDSTSTLESQLKAQADAAAALLQPPGGATPAGPGGGPAGGVNVPRPGGAPRPAAGDGAVQ